jgi:glucose/arabinose dehydrogenase
MRIDQPQFNHNGGALAFGPDRNLYISLGDGGAGDDQGPGHAAEGNAQNMQTVLGKVLRINVDGAGAASANGQYNIPADNPFAAAGDAGADEIYASGFRNPFRMSFTADGRLIVGDVGQENVEEINVVTRGGNYGWRVKEGTFPFNPNGLEQGDSTVTIPGTPGLPAGLIDPLLQYDKSDGNAIIAGYLYEGDLLPEDFVGQYIFGDLGANLGEPSGRLFISDLVSGEIFSLLNGSMDFFLKGFGIGEDGEIYALVSTEIGPQGTTGMILRLVPAQVPEPGALGLLGLGILSIIARRAKAKT